MTSSVGPATMMMQSSRTSVLEEVVSDGTTLTVATVSVTMPPIKTPSSTAVSAATISAASSVMAAPAAALDVGVYHAPPLSAMEVGRSYQTVEAAPAVGTGDDEEERVVGDVNLTARDVYCEGPLLEAVQMARLFPDSKTFVDMPMKQDPAVVLEAFSSLSDADRCSSDKLAEFVGKYFDEAGSDIVAIAPSDFRDKPSFLNAIEDEQRREWAESIHKLWALLVRKVVDDVTIHPQRHSLLARAHPVVVPGGRFRESYYWDTYWTVRGLLVSGMVDTARGAVLNLLDDVDRFGFVPNGGRLYYTERSQPPLLSEMVCDVYSACPDHAFLSRALPSLEAEHAFWMDFERGRAVCVPALPPPSQTSTAMSHGTTPEGAAVLLNRYWGALDPPTGLDDAAGGKGVGGPLPLRPPRPESFREDMDAARGKCACGHASENAEDQEGGAEKGIIGGLPVGSGPNGACHELAAAAESGWDFSSRWAGIASRDERMLSGKGICPTRVMATAAGAAAVAAAVAEAEADAEESGSDRATQEGKDKRHDAKDEEGEKEEHKPFCLCEIATTSVVPVDLNSFLHRAELNIARLHHALAGGPVSSYRATSLSSSSSCSSSENNDGVSCTPTTEPSSPARDGETMRGNPIAAHSVPGTYAEYPPLLSLDEIQRQFLARKRLNAISWASSSATLIEKLKRQGKVDFAASADGESGADVHGSDGFGDEGARPLSRKAMLFAAAARSRSKAMEQTMWDGSSDLWRDVLLPTGEQSTTITPACFAPMWAGLPWPRLDLEDGEDSGVSIVAEEADERLARCVKALRDSDLVHPGGVCTTLEDSGQQWDGRNAWPPLQWILIEGLRRSAHAVTEAELAAERVRSLTAMSTTTSTTAATTTNTLSSAPITSPPAEPASQPLTPSANEGGVTEAKKLAGELEETFLKGALAGWERTGAMMEKYDAKTTGKGGGGGEYDLQTGFGWTNGVALDLMAKQSRRPKEEATS